MSVSYVAFGAGVQTTAMLVLAAVGKVRADAFAFADTRGEHDETYAYLNDVAVPYARDHDITITRVGDEWTTPSYYGGLEAYALRNRMVPSTWTRWCTNRYKVQPLERWAKATLGASKAHPVEVQLGISTDEAHRAKPSISAAFTKRYPLIEMGLSRADCIAIITDAGLPVPPKSGCFYCPFQRQGQWQQQKRERPDLFARSLEMERNAKPHRDGTPRYLPMFGSLERVAAQDEIPGFDAATADEAGCVTGSCFV